MAELARLSRVPICRRPRPTRQRRRRGTSRRCSRGAGSWREMAELARLSRVPICRRPRPTRQRRRRGTSRRCSRVPSRASPRSAHPPEGEGARPIRSGLACRRQATNATGTPGRSAAARPGPNGRNRGGGPPDASAELGLDRRAPVSDLLEGEAAEVRALMALGQPVRLDGTGSGRCPPSVSRRPAR